MRYLKTNTATTITVGPFFDKTDGITPEVALTATNEKLTMVVDNAGTPTLTIDANATGSGGNNDFVHVTNDDSGYYTLELAAANVNYLGGALLSITYATDHCPVFHEFTILPAQVYDSMISGSDLLDISVVQMAGSTTNVSALATNADAIKTKTDFLPSATAGAAGGVFIAGTNAATTVTTALTTTFTGNVTGSVASVGSGGITAATIATDAIDADALSADAMTEIFTKIFTTAMTEAYSTKNGTLTLAQALYELIQTRQEATTGGGVTETVKKRDQSTTALTLTLNSATAPTSVTRAT